MTINQNKFFLNEVSAIRTDKHAANAFVPIGTHIYEDLSDTLTHVLTPPEGAVAFYGNLIIAGGVVRYTLDGVTNPTNTIGFNSISSSSVIYITPGVPLRVKASVASTAINIQWLGTV